MSALARGGHPAAALSGVIMAGASAGLPVAGTASDDYASMRAMWLSGKAGGGGVIKAPPTASAGAASAAPGGAAPSVAVKRTPPPPVPASAKRPRTAPFGAGPTRPLDRTGPQGQTRLDGSVIKNVGRQDSARLPPGQMAGTTRNSGSREPRECTITLAFVSKFRFAATSSFPPKEVSDLYKTNMGRYEPDGKRWTFPFEQYHKLAARLQQVCRSQIPGYNLSVKGIPDGIVAIVREGLDRGVQGAAAQANASASSSAEALVIYEKVPLHLRQSLMDFQREGVLFGLARKGRVLIGDEMGLGKTIQAIAIAAAYMADWPLLIVCPSSMRNVWAQELVRWLPGIVSADDINLIYTSRDPVSTCPVTIISYDLFAKLSHDIRQKGFKVVIADESHYLKNGQAKRTIAIVPAVRQAKHAILLTGTPALARPIELFNLLNCLHPSLFPNYLEYAKRYCAAHQGPFGLDTGGSSNLEELHMVLQKHAMIRRLKKHVLTQLPPKRRQRIMLEMPSGEAAKFSAQIEKLKELESQADDPDAADEDRMAASSRKRNLIMKLYVDTGQAKIAAVREYVSDLLECGAKFLIFAHHMPVLDGLEECVKQRKVKYIRIDGRTPSSERQRRVALFQSQSDVRVAVLSITAAGTGLTLTAAQTVVFAELHWTPGVLLQAEDRVHRIGQNGSSVNIHYLIAQGTCDDLIWDSIAHKLRVVGRTLDGQGVALSASKAEACMSTMQAQISSSQMIGAPADATSTSDEVQLPQAGQAKLEAYGLALSQLYANDGDRPSAAAPARASASGTNDSESVPCAAVSPLPETAGLQEVLEGERPVQQINITLEGGHVVGGMPTKGEVDSQKMNMLLAHPVVVKAMQNPNLDAILSRMLAGDDDLGDEQFLAEFGQDSEMLQLYQTVNRIMNMGQRSLSTSARRSSGDAASQPRPLSPLRGGGGGDGGGTGGCDEVKYAIEPRECSGFASPGDDMVMQELMHAKSQLQRSRKQIAVLQAQLQAEKMGLSSQSAFSSPSRKLGPTVPNELEQMLSAVSSASPDKALDNGVLRSNSREPPPGSLESSQDFGKTLNSLALSSQSRQTTDTSSQDKTEALRQSRPDIEAMWNEAECVAPIQIQTKSRRGPPMPVEGVPSPEDEKDSGPLATDRTEVEPKGATEAVSSGAAAVSTGQRGLEPPAEDEGVDAPQLVGELQDLAHEFPGCAKYLMKELDSRRLLTKAGKTLTEEKMQRLMKRVAERSHKPDIKVMALFIREKLAGSERNLHRFQGTKISADLNVLRPEDAAATRKLSHCRCPMTRGMQCRCGAAEPKAGAGAFRGSLQNCAKSGKLGRRKYGSLVLDPEQVAAKVEEMGGVSKIDGQQGRKGGGWKTVAAALGVDVDVFRDCGFQMKRLYCETIRREVQEDVDTSTSNSGPCQKRSRAESKADAVT